MFLLVALCQPDAEPGDVIITLQLTGSDTFVRQQDNLRMTKVISLADSLCGCSFSITQLDDRQLLVKRMEGQVIKPGKSHCGY